MVYGGICFLLESLLIDFLGKYSFLLSFQVYGHKVDCSFLLRSLKSLIYQQDCHIPFFVPKIICLFLTIVVIFSLYSFLFSPKNQYLNFVDPLSDLFSTKLINLFLLFTISFFLIYFVFLFSAFLSWTFNSFIFNLPSFFFFFFCLHF